MTKKALCVGINAYTQPGAALNGCVNDARDWASLLKERYQFDEALRLEDEEATKARIMGELDKLVTNAKAGDVLVYTFSGHGTYVADADGDEPDFDEAQCAYDGNIIDDELRELFAKLAEGVRLTVISDSCHSGSVTRGEGDKVVELRDQRQERFLSPELFGGRVLAADVFAKARNQMSRLRSAAKEVELGLAMNEVLLSGCQADESSYDALFNGRYRGAMTHHAFLTLSKLGYQITYQELHDELWELIQEAGFPQSPQLEGKRVNKQRTLFS